MRILVICDARVPVPPLDYGGTEGVAAMLCETLSKRGHTVDLIAAENSACYSGRLLTHKSPTHSKWSRVYRKLKFQWLSFRAAMRADGGDQRRRADYLWLICRLKKPIVFVFHNPVEQSDVDAVTSLNPHKAAPRVCQR